MEDLGVAPKFKNVQVTQHLRYFQKNNNAVAQTLYVNPVQSGDLSKLTSFLTFMGYLSDIVDVRHELTAPSFPCT